MIDMALRDRFTNLDIDFNTDEREIEKQLKAHADETLIPVNDNDMANVFDEIASGLSQKVASVPIWFDYTEVEQRKMISDFLINKLENDYSDISFSNEEREHIISLFMNSVKGFGLLDSYIVRDDVKSVMLNCDGSIVVNTYDGSYREEGVLSETEFDKIFTGIGARAESSMHIKHVRINNLNLTFFEPPVCSKKILFEKLKVNRVDLKYFLQDGSINQKIFEFIQSLIKEKHNILVIGEKSSGKTAFLSALAQEAETYGKTVILENSRFINTDCEEKFSFAGLSESEINSVVSVCADFDYDYIINDSDVVSVILSDYWKKGVYSSLSTSNISNAVSKLSAYKSFVDKSTDKFAKAFIASKYDYIFVLEKSADSVLKIHSVEKLSLNKAGSLVTDEILLYENGDYIFKN